MLCADGAAMIYLNLQDRNVPKGIQIGKDARSLVLETNDDLTKVRHFGLEYELLAIEVSFTFEYFSANCSTDAGYPARQYSCL